MGGFFSAPSIAPPPAPAPLPAAADPEEDARKQRLDAIARNRRGRAGTVQTSHRGVLDPVAGPGKSLLGE